MLLPTAQTSLGLEIAIPDHSTFDGGGTSIPHCLPFQCKTEEPATHTSSALVATTSVARSQPPKAWSVKSIHAFPSQWSTWAWLSPLAALLLPTVHTSVLDTAAIELKK